jgi:hypothetical protein
VVLFGGLTSTVPQVNDTWEWDGANWIQRTPATSPPARYHHAMAYDATRQRVVLFGGFVGGIPLADTWEWDGNTWIQRQPATSPPARGYHVMAYDAARKRVVLFGGKSFSSSLNDTWEWHGTTWTQATPGMSPSSRVDHAMAYDAGRRRMVLFGGTNSSYSLNDTWEYSGTVLNASGTPRPGQLVNLVLTAIGEAGRPYQIGSSLGTGPTPIGGRLLGLSVDNLLIVSVGGWWPSVFLGYRGVIGPTGQAAAAIRIPAIPSLVGTTIHSAFVTSNPAAPQGIQAISNTESFRIVP